MKKNILKAVKIENKPSKEEAMEAVRTLIAYAGDDPHRQELLDTPRRVVESYDDYFSGYNTILDKNICRTFDKTHDYDDIIMLKDIRLESICEHHMAPIIGRVAVGYIPKNKIIGLSKLARIVDYHAKRLQIQERLVVEIANTINEIVDAKGVGVVIESSHQCMTTRGVHKAGALMRTSHMIGNFKERYIRQEFMESILNKNYIRVDYE